MLSWELSRRCSSLWYGWRVLDADGENLHNVHHLSGGNSIFLYFFHPLSPIAVDDENEQIEAFCTGNSIANCIVVDNEWRGREEVIMLSQWNRALRLPRVVYSAALPWKEVNIAEGFSSLQSLISFDFVHKHEEKSLQMAKAIHFHPFLSLCYFELNFLEKFEQVTRAFFCWVKSEMA